MNQNIITYLRENKEKYLKDVLATELRKSGYVEGDIAEGIAQVFGGVAQTLASAKTSFWNFKDKKVYTKSSEKWADFLFGFFAPIPVFMVLVILGVVFNTTRVFGNFVFLFGLGATIYFFNRRRLISYGLLASAVIVPMIFLALIAVIF